jgi:hypothetical protein
MYILFWQWANMGLVIQGVAGCSLIAVHFVMHGPLSVVVWHLPAVLLYADQQVTAGAGLRPQTLQVFLHWACSTSCVVMLTWHRSVVWRLACAHQYYAWHSFKNISTASLMLTVVCFILSFVLHAMAAGA